MTLVLIGVNGNCHDGVVVVTCVSMTKDDRINLRISGPQREAWEDAARQADRSLADWIRFTVERICSGQDVALPADPEQRKRWEQAAAADRRTLTDWIRIQLDDAAERFLRSQQRIAAPGEAPRPR